MLLQWRKIFLCTTVSDACVGTISIKALSSQVIFNRGAKIVWLSGHRAWRVAMTNFVRRSFVFLKLSSVILRMNLELATGVGFLHSWVDLRRGDHYIARCIIRMVKVLSYLQRSYNVRRIRLALIFEQCRFLHLGKQVHIRTSNQLSIMCKGDSESWLNHLSAWAVLRFPYLTGLLLLSQRENFESLVVGWR